MDKQKIKEQLEIVIRNANWISEKLDNADINITEERRLFNAVRKAKSLLGEALAVM